MPKQRLPLLCALIAAAFALPLGSGAVAQTMDIRNYPLDRLTFIDPELDHIFDVDHLGTYRFAICGSDGKIFPPKAVQTRDDFCGRHTLCQWSAAPSSSSVPVALVSADRHTGPNGLELPDGAMDSFLWGDGGVGRRNRSDDGFGHQGFAEHRI